MHHFPKHPIIAGLALLLSLLGVGGQLIGVFDFSIPPFYVELAWVSSWLSLAACLFINLRFETKGLMIFTFASLVFIILISGEEDAFGRSFFGSFLLCLPVIYALKSFVSNKSRN